MKKIVLFLLSFGLSFLFFNSVFSAYSLPSFYGSGFSLAPTISPGAVDYSNVLFYNSSGYETYIDTLACSEMSNTSSGVFQTHLLRNYAPGYSLVNDNNVTFTVAKLLDGASSLFITQNYTSQGVYYAQPTDFVENIFDFVIPEGEKRTLCINVRFVNSTSPTVGGTYLYKYKLYFYSPTNGLYIDEKYYTNYSALGKPIGGVSGGSYYYFGAKINIVNNSYFSGFLYQGNTGASLGLDELNTLTLSGFLSSTGRTNSLMNFFNVTDYLDTPILNGSGNVVTDYSSCHGFTDFGCYISVFSDSLFSIVTTPFAFLNDLVNFINFFITGENILFPDGYQSCYTDSQVSQVGFKSLVPVLTNLFMLVNPLAPFEGQVLCKLDGTTAVAHYRTGTVISENSFYSSTVDRSKNTVVDYLVVLASIFPLIFGAVLISTVKK